MRTRQSKAAEWVGELKRGDVKLWTTSDTRSIRLAAHNRSRRATEQEIEELLGYCMPPMGAVKEDVTIPVDQAHEVKARKFWCSMFTKSGARRANQTTSWFTELAWEILTAYVQEGKGRHYFAGLEEQGRRYRDMCPERVLPVWRLVVPGVGQLDYTYGSWQSGYALEILLSTRQPARN